MPLASVLNFAEPTRTMTVPECLEFIARTRRQLDRFGTAMPHAEGIGISPEKDAKLRTMLSELEAEITPLMPPT